MMKIFEYYPEHLFFSTNLDGGVECGKTELVPNGVHAFLALKKRFDTGGVLTEHLKAFAGQWEGGAHFCSLTKGLLTHLSMLWEGNFDALYCCQWILLMYFPSH